MVHTYHMAMAGRSLSLLRRQCWLSSIRLCSAQATSSPPVNVQDERVQALLSQLTGMDLDKVFTARKEPLLPPTYKLLTRKGLEKVRILVLLSMRDNARSSYLNHVVCQIV